MDVNNSKDAKDSVIICTKEEEEVEKMARSPRSGCSCSGESNDDCHLKRTRLNMLFSPTLPAKAVSYCLEMLINANRC